MKARSNQIGFSVVELLLIVVVVAGLGFVGYFVYNRQQSETLDSASSTKQQAAEVDSLEAPAVNSVSDLDEANQTLDQSDPETSSSSDSNQLDSQLSGF